MKSMRALFVFFVTALIGMAADAPKISAADAARLVADGKAVLVDCREPAEWKDAGVAAPAVLLPKSDFDGDQKQWKEFLAKNPGKQVVVYCRSGGRAAAVASALREKGVDASNMGGLSAWTKAGLPTRAADESGTTKPKAKK
jgi:rhodanese-related sulfurtransferase